MIRRRIGKNKKNVKDELSGHVYLKKRGKSENNKT